MRQGGMKALRKVCIAYYEVVVIRLSLMERLELVESSLSTWQAQSCGFLHETQLGIEVCQFLRVGQHVPVKP